MRNTFAPPSERQAVLIGTPCVFCGTALMPLDRFCPTCNAEVPASLQTSTEGVRLDRVSGSRETAFELANRRQVQSLREARAAATGMHEAIVRGASVEGTIISSEPVAREPVRGSAAHRLQRGLVALEVCLLAVVALLWMMSSGSFLLILGLGTVFLLLPRMIRPLGLLFMGGLIGGRRHREDVAVRHYRLRTADRREISLRAVGELRGSHIMPGDYVSAWGRWRAGGLHLRSSMNLRTGAETRFESSLHITSFLFHALALLVLLTVILPALTAGLGAIR